MQFLVQNDATGNTFVLEAADWPAAEGYVDTASTFPPVPGVTYTLLGEFIESGETPSERTDH